MARWLLFLATLLAAEESFITPQEYAAQLYHNPRGIGCNLCHGEHGEGKVIAHYTDKGVRKSFTAPAINVIGFEDFDRALNGRVKGMPRYFLTEEERHTLYRYLHPKDANVPN
ncbi:cytochrome c [Sulfurimonas sp. HSL-3221]|uniref:c-type cytochrome n=1 Tax=Sulfurimonadaceae TaxID=2771471 RepID=UPI001E528DA1|nr:cytochrome c [Sulfurimonas sp. HSL-3221]UFS63753.1 cytochrome c [Sulfurimonas sp. HSL-3221]